MVCTGVHVKAQKFPRLSKERMVGWKSASQRASMDALCSSAEGGKSGGISFLVKALN